MKIGNITNPRLSWWGPKRLDEYVVEFKCPTDVSFDSTGDFWNTHCPWFSYTGNGDFDFSSTNILFSSDTKSIDENPDV